MMRKGLAMLALISSSLLSASAVSAAMTVTLPGGSNNSPKEIVTIEPGGGPARFQFIVDGVAENTVTVNLACARGDSGCVNVTGRQADSNDDFQPEFNLLNISKRSLITVELVADLPTYGDYSGALLLTAGPNESADINLTFKRSPPAWREPDDADKPTVKTLKIDVSGHASVGIAGNDLDSVDPSKITLTLSEFVNDADGSRKAVNFVTQGGPGKDRSQKLTGVNLGAGSDELELDASALEADKTYRGRIQFTTEGSAAPQPPPLTLKLQRVPRNPPVWREPDDEGKPAVKTLKIGESGRASIGIVGNDFDSVDTSKITLTLSEFVSETDGSRATVNFIRKGGAGKDRSVTLTGVDLGVGSDELELDASALEVDKIYRGSIRFTTEGTAAAPQPTPLTLKLERVTPAGTAVLVADSPLGSSSSGCWWPRPLGLCGPVIIDVPLREQSGLRPLRGVKLTWRKTEGAGAPQQPAADSLTMELIVDGHAVPLWLRSGKNPESHQKPNEILDQGAAAGRDRIRKPAVIPAHSTAFLHIKAEELDVGQYRLPLRLWAENTDRSKDAEISLDFTVERPPWIPYLVLLAAIFLSYFMNRLRSNRIEADAVMHRIGQLLRGPALDLSRCGLLPVVQTYADVRMAEVAMRQERSGWKILLMSAAVTAKVKERLDLIEKRIPQVDRLGRLWGDWNQPQMDQMVSHRARRELRGTAIKMAEQLRLDQEFDAGVGEALGELEMWSDPKKQFEKYWACLETAIQRLWDQCNADEYSKDGGLKELGVELKKLERTALDRLPVAMQVLDELKSQHQGYPELPLYVDEAVNLWQNDGQQKLEDLKSSLDSLDQAVDQIEYSDTRKIFAAASELVTRCKEPLWTSLERLSGLADVQTTATDLRERVVGGIKSVLGALHQIAYIAESAKKRRLSQRETVGYLLNALNLTRSQPPESLDDAVKIDRGYYAPLKVIHTQKTIGAEEGNLEALFWNISEKLNLDRDPAELPNWKDADLTSLFDLVDGQAWKLLKGVNFEKPRSGDVFPAYQLVDFSVNPESEEEKNKAYLTQTYAFKHDFLYQWKINYNPDSGTKGGFTNWVRHLLNGTGSKAPTEQPFELTTREPVVRMFVPRENAEFTATVAVYRNDSLAGGDDKRDASVTFHATESEHRKRNRQLRTEEGVSLIVVFIVAIGAGIATEQFTAAMYGSITALFTLFATGMALQQVQNWTTEK